MTAKGQDSLDWDLNGQMTTGITSSMTWTWDGKLQSASAGGASIDLKYAPGFDRVYKESTVNQTTTKSKYIVDPTGDLTLILLEVDPDDNDPNTSIRKTYLYANSQVIAQHDGHYGDDIYFYLHDRLGSVRQVIDTDANVENKYVYQPFGESFASEVAETITNDFKFTGQFYDSEIEQYYLRARMYDPAAYRFASRDPYEGSFENPLELHRYLYCLNEPVDYCDPTGESLILGLVGGMGGSAWMRSQEAKARAGQLAAVTALVGYVAWKTDWYNLGLALATLTDDVTDNFLDVALSVYAIKDSSKNERHGDQGRSLEKAKKQIAELEEKLKNASGREAKKIKKKIEHIWQDAQKKSKGETHHRT